MTTIAELAERHQDKPQVQGARAVVLGELRAFDRALQGMISESADRLSPWRPTPWDRNESYITGVNGVTRYGWVDFCVELERRLKKAGVALDTLFRSHNVGLPSGTVLHPLERIHLARFNHGQGSHNEYENGLGAAIAGSEFAGLSRSTYDVRSGPGFDLDWPLLTVLEGSLHGARIIDAVNDYVKALTAAELPTFDPGAPLPDALYSPQQIVEACTDAFGLIGEEIAAKLIERLQIP